jgi:hypothetical protein
MPLYITKIKARSPIDGTMTEYHGPHVPGNSIEEAQEYCEQNGLGYCWVDDELISEIPVKDGRADWGNRKDY